MLYARIVGGAVQSYKEYAQTLDLAAIRHVNGEPMLRPVVDTSPPVDVSSGVKTGPVVTINPTNVVRVWAVRPKTAQELDADKETKVNSQQVVLLKIPLNHENRIRVLEGKPAVTMAQLKTAIKGLL